MNQIIESYKKKQSEINNRLKEFQQPKTQEDVFYELCFCIMAVQTSGIKAGKIADELKRIDFLNKNINPQQILRNGYIRFHNNKAKHLQELKSRFQEIQKKLKTTKDNHELRKWLVKNIKGIGMKEASHFLRNIGRTEELAILDRHILRNMQEYKIISEQPKTLTTKIYLELEKRFQNFSKYLNLTPAQLDLYFWAKETGVVFK
jgi:N-glycosylase/DNA lyase